MGRLSSVVEKPFKKTLSFKNEKFNKKTKKVDQEVGWYFYTKSETEGELYIKYAQSFFGTTANLS